MMNRLRVALLLLLPLVWGVVGVRADEPFFTQTNNPVPLAPRPVTVGPLLVEEAGARRALAMGFPSVAATLYEELLAHAPAGPATDELLLSLVEARLDEGRTDLAQAALAKFRGAPSSSYRLLSGLVAVRQRRMSEATTVLGTINPAELAPDERGWWHYAQGLIAEADKDYEKATSAFQQAQESAISDLQRARFLLARERSRLESGAPVTDEQLDQLKASVEKYQGRAVGYDYARQYAMTLAQAGRKTGAGSAVDFLQKQLAALPLSEPAVRDDYRLLIGLIAGASNKAGRDALDALVADGVDRDKQRVALQLLAVTAGDDTASSTFRTRLNGWIDAPRPSPILENLLLVRAETALAVQDYSQAEADAKAVVERFPQSPLRAAAFAQLADASWQQRRFRAAASYAAQARDATRDPAARALFGVLVAESYYRAGDYRSAAGAYAAALARVPAGVSAGGLMFQQVMSELKSGDADALTRAQTVADRLAADRRFDAVSRWQTEWNLALAMQSAGRTADALARVTRLRAETPGVPPNLRARMAWLEARLALDSGAPERALALAKNFAEPRALEGVESVLRRELPARSLLLQAEANFALGNPAEAVAQLRKLRTDAQDSDTKMRSFIVEADYYARTGNLAEAQRLMTSLADDYRTSSYAPEALYQAALHAARRGGEEHIREAYRLLERLAKDYPASDLVFYARMKQGDLAREYNNFSDAQLAYEYLINNYSQHADVLAAHLALANCHRARSAPPDVSHYESALTIYERLRDLADTRAGADLRVEAGFQLGDMLADRGDTDRALRAWWVVEDAFLLNEERAAELGPKGRYWMARLLLRKAELLESAARHEEARTAWQLIITKGLPGATLGPPAPRRTSRRAVSPPPPPHRQHLRLRSAANQLATFLLATHSSLLATLFSPWKASTSVSSPAADP